MPPSASRNHVYGYTVLVLSALIWGTEGVLAKLCYNSGFSIISLSILRYMLALPLFAFLAMRFKAPFFPPRALLKRMLLLSVNVVAGVALLYMALSLLPAALAILFFYAYPSFTSILYRLMGRGSVGAIRVAALIISAAGLLLLYWSSLAGLSLWGVACALLSAALQAGKLYQTASLLEQVKVWTLNFFTALFTVTAFTLFGLIYAAFGYGGIWPVDIIMPAGLVYVLMLGLVVTVFGNLFMNLGIGWLGAVDTSLVLLLEPPTTAVLAYMVFGDMLSSWQMVGGALILAAVALPAAVNLRKHAARASGKI